MQSRYTETVAELIRAQAARGTPFRFRVTSGSMAPLIVAGDEVVVCAVAVEALVPGMLVLFDAGGLFVVHRLRARLPDGLWRTQGDRNVDADRPWASGALVGRVTGVVHGGIMLDITAGPGQARAQWLGRVASVEQAVYGAVRRIKRVLVGRRRLGLSVGVTRVVRGPFGWLARGPSEPPQVGESAPQPPAAGEASSQQGGER